MFTFAKSMSASTDRGKKANSPRNSPFETSDG